MWLLAGPRRRLALLFGWALAEAVAWPVMPDAALAPLAAYHHGEWWWLATAASLGSVAGAGLSYLLGRYLPRDLLLVGLPLVRPAMVQQARSRLEREGPAGVRHQPFSTLPLKVYAIEAGGLRRAPGPFLGAVVLARAARFLLVGGLAALVGRRLWSLLWRWPTATLLLWTGLFGLGLWLAVRAWERREPPAPAAPSPEG